MATSLKNEQYGLVSLYTWTLTTADDTGDAVVIPSDADKSIHVFGTFGSGTVTLQGSNEIGTPTDWGTLHAPDGGNLAFTAGGLEGVSENCLQYRPVLSGSTAATVTVILMTRRTV